MRPKFLTGLDAWTLDTEENTDAEDEDVMETSPAAKSASDHPSRVQSIVKMAPQSPCSDNHEDNDPRNSYR